jgi:hypothetical protein
MTRRVPWILVFVALLAATLVGQQLQTGPWTMTGAGDWTQCIAGEQTRIEQWSRTFQVTEGTQLLCECSQQEQRVGKQPCSFALIQASDLTYVGAFRVPLGSTASRPYKTYAYGGTGLSYSGHDTVYLVGHDWDQMTGEMSIPTPGTGATVASLPRAVIVQPWADILQGKRTTVDGTTGSGVKIGGIIPTAQGLLVNVWDYYDAGSKKQTLSHFFTGTNFSTLTPADVRGPYQVGTGFQYVTPTDTSRIGGFVSGYMTPIPAAYQGTLGGTHLSGQGGYVSIVDRTSSGPSASVFTASNVGVTMPDRSVVMGYPSQPSKPNDPLNHPALGMWGVGGGAGLYDGTQGFRGMVFVEGTRSVLFFGWSGSKFCYGAGTLDPSLNGKPNPAGGVWCYDPSNPQGKGTHGWPYKSVVYAYDVDDFVQAKRGIKQPWEVVPYATWTLTLPFQAKMVNGVDAGTYEIYGASYDPTGKRIFVSAYRTDGDLPLIHVLRVP